MAFKGLHDGIRCQAVAKATGERCRCVAVKGATLCTGHGGHRQIGKPSPRIAIGMAAKRRFCQMQTDGLIPVGWLDLDPALRASGWRWRLYAAEAWLTARAQGDPSIWRDALDLIQRRQPGRMLWAGVTGGGGEHVGR